MNFSFCRNSHLFYQMPEFDPGLVRTLVFMYAFVAGNENMISEH